MKSIVKTEQNLISNKSLALAGLATVLAATRFGLFATAAGLFIAGVTAIFFRGPKNTATEVVLQSPEKAKESELKPSEDKKAKTELVAAEIAAQPVVLDEKRQLLLTLAKNSAAVAQNSLAWIKADAEVAKYNAEPNVSVLAGNKLRRQ